MLAICWTNLLEMIYVDKTKLLQIESEVINICSPIECKTILPLIKKLKYKSLKEMLSNYPSYTVKLAEKSEKPINAFSIEGDDLLVDSDKYNGFVKPLIHVFRNSVDHGLESSETRVERGKPEQAVRILRDQNIDIWLRLVRETIMNSDPVLPFISKAEFTSLSEIIVMKNGKLIVLAVNYSIEDVA